LPYSYLWSNGSTVQDPSGLTANTYNVTVTDANGCINTASATVTQPTALSGNITSQTNVACFGDNSGSVTVAGSGGTPSYQYSINGGASYQGSGTFNNLSSGNYTIIVRDNNLCTYNIPVTITQPAAALSASASATDVSCFGGSDGSIIHTHGAMALHHKTFQD